MKTINFDNVNFENSHTVDVFLFNEILEAIYSDSNVYDIVTNGNIASILQVNELYKKECDETKLLSIEPYIVGKIGKIILKISPIMRYDSNIIYLNDKDKKIVEIIKIVDTENKLKLL